ncbi:MAG TPA: EamA family transporter [Acidobacteriaceae bacterium]|nr:EamA family transporter [Acidobacteriaceae bacterium]
MSASEWRDPGAPGQVLRNTKGQALGYGSCALAGTFWGTGFFFGKIALTQLSVGHMVFYRFLFACLGLAPLLRPARLNKKDWTLLLTAAFLGIPLQFLIQFYGLSLTTVSHAALMVGTMPVILALGAVIFAGEHLDWKGWLALAGSTTGVTLITLSGSRHPSAHGPSLTGDLLVVFSLVIALGWVLISRELMHRHPPITITAYTIFAGTIMLAFWIIPIDGLPPIHGLATRVWIACAAGGLLCTSASTFLWNWGIHRVPASRAGVFLNIEPALGSILGVELLGDKLGPAAWLGGALILTAAIVLTATGHVNTEAILE